MFADVQAACGELSRPTSMPENGLVEVMIYARWLGLRGGQNGFGTGEVVVTHMKMMPASVELNVAM